MLMSIARENHNDLNPFLTAVTIQGGNHGSDWLPPHGTDSASLKAERSYLMRVVGSWISGE